MKLFKNLLALLVALTCVFTVVACDNNDGGDEELDTTKLGWAYEYEIEEPSDENDKKAYIVVTGLFLADGEKHALNEGTYDSIDVNFTNGVKVPVYEKKNYRIVLSNQGKMVSINNVEKTKISDYIGEFPTIFFSPSDLEIITSSPTLIP